MSVLHTMRRGVRGVDLGHGLGGWALNAGVAVGTGYLVGQLNQRHADKVYGKHAARMAAATGKLGSVVAALVFGPGVVSGAVDTVGNVGLGLMGADLGLRHGAEAKGVELKVVPKGTAVGRPVSIGALPPAQRGRGMSYDQIAQLAASR